MSLNPLVIRAAHDIGEGFRNNCLRLMIENGMTREQAVEVIRKAFEWMHKETFMEKFSNELTDAQLERLAILSEELGEAQRHEEREGSNETK